jgi:hypothetical protein
LLGNLGRPTALHDVARNGLVLVATVASCRLLYLFPCWRSDSLTVPCELDWFLVFSIFCCNGWIFYTSPFLQFGSGSRVGLAGLCLMCFWFFTFGSITRFGPVEFALPYLGCIYAFCVVAGLRSSPPGFLCILFRFFNPIWVAGLYIRFIALPYLNCI